MLAAPIISLSSYPDTPYTTDTLFPPAAATAKHSGSTSLLDLLRMGRNHGPRSNLRRSVLDVNSLDTIKIAVDQRHSVLARRSHVARIARRRQLRMLRQELFCFRANLDLLEYVRMGLRASVVSLAIIWLDSRHSSAHTYDVRDEVFV